MLRLSLTLAILAVAGWPQTPPGLKLGHSVHGEAYDVGPREKPVLMNGIGKAHLPVTCKAEVQQWVDQGQTLLHSFWYYEAERSFRWALKLDPECAMAYWGMARTVQGDRKRALEFLGQASKRKLKVSERERMYIESLEAYLKDDPLEPERDREARDRDYGRKLEDLCLKHPDDIEAKSLYGLHLLGSANRLGAEALLNQVIEKAPMHPGAHHYRIHTWDGERGSVALSSCELYGKIAPAIGHAQHMPGHIYSGVGMWHEGAISMETATRVEAGYMRRHMVFPFNDWNYAHNRNYLSFIQEQLGMPSSAIAGARELLRAPYDPQYNPEKTGNRSGKVALMRAQIKFERWNDILDPKNVVWGGEMHDRILRLHAETLAHIGLGQILKAEETFRQHAALKKEIGKSENKWLASTYEIQAGELKAGLLLARGDTLQGLSVLAEAAVRELAHRKEENDPPFYANVLYNSLGREYLKQKSPALAVTAFEKTLSVVKEDGFALAGLVEANQLLGQKEKAEEALARLLYVWGDAEPGLKWLERVKALPLQARARDGSPGRQRRYRSVKLESFGPLEWERYRAPLLEAVDPKGKRVTLDEYKGKNVLLIFYLGEECPHCLEQLVELAKRKADLSRSDTEVLAVSSNSPDQNAESLKLGEVPFRLLSDVKLENAKRWKSYDDFEDLPLHSTILIDKQGRVHWARNGGDPFTDFDFLLKEIKRLD